MATAQPSTAASYLRAIGAFSFDRVAPLVLAALVTEDPLLLIGASGTGKTFLLNSLSEALGLEHRHYNASLISFDDLVGFPFPDPEKGGVTFLQTPATVWGAESVLVDEISRCKPEHQNRLFSLIHERRIQGIALDRLRFRWAAMNPCSTDQEGLGYSGSEPLDLALGDRFGLFIEAADWGDLEDEDRALIAHPAGEGALAEDGGALRQALATWRERFQQQATHCPRAVQDYVVAATTFLNSHGVRVSPRRARFLSRSLLAGAIVVEGMQEDLAQRVLAASLPHLTWGEQIEPKLIEAAHLLAWDSAFLQGDRKWVHLFHCERSLPRKVGLLLCSPGPDAATQAIAEFIGTEPYPRVAALCLALYPAASQGLGTLGAGGIHDLGKVAMPILSVSGDISWQERLDHGGSSHPEIVRFNRVLDGLAEPRRSRARQLFSHFLVKKLLPDDPAALEQALADCVGVIQKALGRDRA